MSNEMNAIPRMGLIQKALVFAPAAAGLTGLELFLQAPLPLEFAFLATAGVLAWKSPEILASLRTHYPDNPMIEQLARAQEQSQLRHETKTDWTLGDRLMGKHHQGAYQAESIQDRASARDAHDIKTEIVQDGEHREHWSFDDEEEDLSPVLPARRGEKVLFSSVLDEGFTPSLERIFLARHPDGTPICVEARDLCHVALAGATGNGKSSIMRLLMAQLCAIRVRVLLLNPHYTRYDRDSGEDWTPFEPYLEKPSSECADYEKIGEYLQWMARAELPRRIQRVRDGRSAGKPFFVVIDELPAIVGEVKDAPVYIAKLLREGRKYGIFLIVASQDFLVKTTGMEGGAVRKCFRTAFYVGGDRATATALLEGGSPIAETSLGKGVIALRCKVTMQVIEARTPYVDNESLYRMLGPSTFHPSSAHDDMNEIHTETLVTSKPEKPITLERLNQLLGSNAISIETFKRLLDTIEITESDIPNVEQSATTPIPATPVVQEKGPRASDIDLAAAIALWNAGYNSENKLMKAFPGLTKYQAGLLRDRILEQANVMQEVVE